MLFLVSDVGTGDRDDSEAEDVDLHHTSHGCVLRTESINLESTNLQIDILEVEYSGQ